LRWLEESHWSSSGRRALILRGVGGVQDWQGWKVIVVLLAIIAEFEKRVLG
jgi:hypothetical protein